MRCLSPQAQQQIALTIEELAEHLVKSSVGHVVPPSEDLQHDCAAVAQSIVVEEADNSKTAGSTQARLKTS